MFRRLVLGLLTTGAAVGCDHCVQAKPSEVAAAPNAASLATTSATSAPFVVHRPLLERSPNGACETLRTKPTGDPIVTWGKHFPVEREGFLATLSTHDVSADDVSKRASALREGSYEVVDCGDSLLFWVEASGSCRALQQSPGVFLDLRGLRARRKMTRAFGHRGIAASGVARRSNTPVCSTPRALLASRIDALGAPGYFAAGPKRRGVFYIDAR